MSIRARLVRLLLVFIVPLVALVGLALMLYVRGALVARFDDGLLTRARTLSGMIKLEDGQIEPDFAREMVPQYERATGAGFFQVWTVERDAPGKPVERSGALGASTLPVRMPADAPLIWNDPLPNGQPGRLVALRTTARHEAPDPDSPGSPTAVVPPPVEHPPLLVVVAQSRAELDRTLTLLAVALGGAGVVLVAGVLVSVRFALARGLAPIRRLAEQVERIDPDDLSKRLDTEGVPGELLPIAQRTNHLLGRVSDAFDREKRLGASAAHELRTPIAEIRAVTEVALSHERAPAEYRRALTTVLGAAQRMGESADALLRLARVQSGREVLTPVPVDLFGALMGPWMRLIAALGGRAVDTVSTVAPGVSVRADPAMLTVILENLCANAAHYASTGGAVRAECRVENAAVVLNLSNSTDPSRAGSAIGGKTEHVHAGLGLVIATAMAEACGGTLVVSAGPDRFEVSLTLPLVGGARG